MSLNMKQFRLQQQSISSKHRASGRKHLAALAAAFVIAGAAAPFLATTASAQTLKSDFFLDNNQFAYRSNPSFMASRSSLGFAISNIGVRAESSLGISDMLYPTSNGLVTGFNPAVSSEEFLGNLSPRSAVNVDVCENILAVNTRKYRNAGNFELNVRTIADFSLPYDMFAFLKNGSSGSAYDLTGLGANAKVLAEVAWGQAFLIGDYVSFGFRLKGLFGLQDLTLTTDKASLKVSQDEFAVDADAYIRASGKYLTYAQKDGILDLDSFDVDAAFWGPQGFGGAVDLGVTVTPIENLAISASVQDVGAIYWKYGLVARTTQTTSYTGVENMDVVEGFGNSGSGSGDGSGSGSGDGSGSGKYGSNPISDEIEAQLDKLAALKDFKVQDPENGIERLPFSANLGVRYTLFGGALSVGALGSFRHGVYINSFDARLGLTTTPIKWFSLTANAGLSTFGPVCGSALSLTLGPFNLHAGLDAMMGKYASVYGSPVPLGKFSCAGKFGLVISFGEWR